MLGLLPWFVFDGARLKLKNTEFKKRTDDRLKRAKKRQRSAMHPDQYDLYDDESISFSNRAKTTKHKNMLEAAGFKVSIAKHDGEALAAHLVLTGQAAALFCDDADALLYGSPLTLFMTIRDDPRGIFAIDHALLLSHLGLTASQFREACLLVGTDYNERCIDGGYGAISVLRELRAVRGDVDELARRVSRTPEAAARRLALLPLVRRIYDTLCGEAGDLEDATIPLAVTDAAARDEFLSKQPSSELLRLSRLVLGVRAAAAYDAYMAAMPPILSPLPPVRASENATVG